MIDTNTESLVLDLGETFENIFRATTEFASTRFLKDGGLINTVLLGWEEHDDEKGASALVVFDDYSPEVRKEMGAILNSAIRKVQEESGVAGQPDYFIQMAEVWTAHEDLDETPIPEKGMPQVDVAPSDRPDRQEALAVHSGHKDGRSMMWIADIYREPQLHLGEPKLSDDPSKHRARIADLLWNNKKSDLSRQRLMEEIGENPSDGECVRFSIGWIRSTVEILGDIMDIPPNVKRALIKGAALIEDVVEIEDD